MRVRHPLEYPRMRDTYSSWRHVDCFNRHCEYFTRGRSNLIPRYHVLSLFTDDISLFDLINHSTHPPACALSLKVESVNALCKLLTKTLMFNLLMLKIAAFYTHYRFIRGYSHSARQNNVLIICEKT